MVQLSKNRHNMDPTTLASETRIASFYRTRNEIKLLVDLLDSKSLSTKLLEIFPSDYFTEKVEDQDEEKSTEEVMDVLLAGEGPFTTDDDFELEDADSQIEPPIENTPDTSPSKTESQTVEIAQFKALDNSAIGDIYSGKNDKPSTSGMIPTMQSIFTNPVSIHHHLVSR